MVCPICDDLLTEDDELHVSNTETIGINKGQFCITHVYWDIEDQYWYPKHPPKYFSQLSIN